MKRLSLLLIALTGCHGSRPIAARPASALHLRVLGEINPDSAPGSCRMHGGSPPVMSGEPALTRNARRDQALDSLGSGRVSIHIVFARTGEPLQTGALNLMPAPPGALAVYVSPDGWGQLRAPAGRYALRIRSIGTSVMLDSLEIRRGYADTLRLAVGQPWHCGM